MNDPGENPALPTDPAGKPKNPNSLNNPSGGVGDQKPLGITMKMLAVFLGGVLGTWCRWGIDTTLTGWAFTQFPWLRVSFGVITVNLLGTLILAIWKTSGVPAYLGQDHHRDHRRHCYHYWSAVDLCFATGFLGSFTTYSSLALAAQQQPLWLAELQIFTVLILGLVAAGIGVFFGRGLQRLIISGGHHG